jgi:C4-dicarboxylate-specific signal transduction histidine kinase
MTTAEQPLRETLLGLSWARRRAAILTGLHVVLVWLLAACAMTQNTVAAVSLATLLTVLGAVAACRTIQLIERAESAQRVKSEQRFLSALMDASPALAAVIDGDGRLLRCNQRFRELFGSASPPDDVLRHPQLKGADKLLGFMASGQPGPFEADLELERPHEQALMLHFAASRHELPASGACIVLVGQDETLRHRAQRSLAQTAKLETLGEVTSGIAHELSQPLNVIRMAAQNLLIEALPPEDTEGDEDELMLPPMPDAAFRPFAAGKLQRIIGQVDRAASIIARMRIFSRASQSGIREFDVRDACESALALMAASFRRAGIAVSANLGQEKVIALGHETLLQQVIVNLLANARDALVDGGSADRQVGLALVRDGSDRIVIEVSDNGPGVPAEIRERIFEPFFTTKPLGTGTGLGLSLAYGLMRDIGGDLKLGASPRGASFRIELRAGGTESRETTDRR